MLVLEAPLSPEMKAGFDRFGFDEHEADPEPFGGRAGHNPRRKPRR
jgi:23S rRNA pseudouridine955/2504/2580 synthase